MQSLPSSVESIIHWLLTLEDSTLGTVITNLNDGGGLTRLGITQRTGNATMNPLFWTPSVSAANAVILATMWYDTHYWQNYGLDKLPMPAAASVLSAIVNCGSQALHWWDLHPNLNDFISRWKIHYEWLAKQPGSIASDLRGWYNRADSIYPIIVTSKAPNV